MTDRRESAILSNRCMPGHLLRAKSSVILDTQYDDFEQQAERLTGFDQSYLQLTRGAFRGRFLSCFLGPGLSLHLEHCTQALEQSIASEGTAFNIGVPISDGPVFRLNGADLGSDDVMIAAPGSTMNLRSPTEGAILAIVVNQDLLEKSTALFPSAQDWICKMHDSVRILRSPELARRIREDTVEALQAANFYGRSGESDGTIGEALLAAIVSRLSLELSGRPGMPPNMLSLSFSRFIECRETIHRNWCRIHSMEDLLSMTGDAGRRAIENSFSEQLKLGPLAYHRVLRLHMVRKALCDMTSRNVSIGDIATHYDFWNLSQFTAQYRELFGERPSETRLKSGGDARVAQRNL